MFSFLAAFVFFLARGNSVHPGAPRLGGALTAVICLVAGVAYWYHPLLLSRHDAGAGRAGQRSLSAQHNIVRDAFFAIGPYRYMDWIVTTPLLLLKTVLLLKVKPREISGWIALLLGADAWMILAGCIGDQQIRLPTARSSLGPHLLWGTLSTAGYLVIPYVLLFPARPHSTAAGPTTRTARRSASWRIATVTTWGVYPLGYLVGRRFFPKLNLNWIHLAYTAGGPRSTSSARASSRFWRVRRNSRAVRRPRRSQPARIST